MAQVTVSELASVVGAPVDRLLTQMREAGLSKSSADDLVTDAEKQQLLAFLKTSHGEETNAPKKITLKRKTVSTIKAGGKRTVAVEVRKKRTYVKRDNDAPEDEPAPVESAESRVDDAELKRQAALEAKRKQEQEREAELKAQEEAEQAKAEAEAKAATVEEEKSNEDVAADNAGKEEPVSKSEADQPVKPDATKEEAEEKTQPAADKANEEAKPAEGAAATKSDEESSAADKDEQKHHRKKDKKHHAEEALDDDEAALKRKKKGGPKPVGNKKAPVVDLAEIEEELELVEEVKPKPKPKAKISKPAKVIKLKNQHGFKKPTEKIVRTVEVGEAITVAELAQQMAVKSGEVVKTLMKMGVMATANQNVDQETAQLVVEEFGHTFVEQSENALEDKLVEEVQAAEGTQEWRAPIVTVMGHVDHGKTSLLDYIRKTKVTAGEAGGITQHIGAYRVPTSHGEIAFLDTPGHAAFTAMRARGAQCTDVVILVVAADDGVMPQTEEAVQHARAAGVPIVVAVNKIDKETADPDRVKNELAAKDVIPEDWGGDTQFVHVSALTGEGVDELLEAVSLQAELLELKAAADIPAKGVVVEARMDKGRGVVCTVLVQQGTLRRGDIMLASQAVGRVRAMTNELGQQVKEAGPSTPVELLGLDSVPNAGEEFMVTPDERRAREVAELRHEREKQDRMQRQQSAKLENMFANMETDSKKVLPIVIKADVRGSLEAILGAMADIGNEEVEVNVVYGGVGGITGNDVNLAVTTGAIVVGFNTRADASARKLAEAETVEIRYYSVIYNLLDEVKAALSGMLDPELREEIVGIAEVRDVFRSPKFGAIAGCMVQEGTVFRNKPIRVLRDNVVIYEGELESLRRFKDDVNEVRNGMECGIGVKDYNDVKVGDQIEVYDVVKVAREL